MKVHISYNSLSLLLLLLLITELSPAQPGNYYPPPSSISYQTDTLIINPPDSLPGGPVVLLGYNIYVDDDFYDNVMVTNPLDPVHFYLDDESLVPGERIFCVDAVYNEWISEESACDTAMIIYGYELPFYEDWSSGSFETLHWTTDSDHWVINSEDGNPAPAATFQGEPGLTDYEAVLESYPINTLGMSIGYIWLDFDIKLEAVQLSNYEQLFVQVWNSSNKVWTTVEEFSDWHGSFNWESKHISIKSYAMDKVFKIRFQAVGTNSTDIAGWFIDDIHVYRNCIQPDELELEEGWEGNVLNWIPPDGPYWDDWIHWDDEMNSGNSIGPNEPVEFDVAARWTPEMLYYFDGGMIDKIAFFPAENAATYWVRVWIGAGPDSLVTDQLVNSPVMNQWNTVTLEIPVILDITKELRVGYHISTPYGWPAGVDDGPAIDEFGNMIFWENEWQTLLDINDELDYNWNIACHLSNNTWGTHFNIYRNTNLQGFELYDVAYEPEYLDNSIVLSEYYCYKVTMVHIDETDTCESSPTNTACEILMLGTGTEEAESLIQIFPNPAKDFLNIESHERISEVRIYNVLGECVLKMEIGNLEGKVDVNGLENGVYFVEVVTEKGNFKDKILIFK